MRAFVLSDDQLAAVLAALDASTDAASRSAAAVLTTPPSRYHDDVERVVLEETGGGDSDWAALMTALLCSDLEGLTEDSEYGDGPSVEGWTAACVEALLNAESDAF